MSIQRKTKNYIFSLKIRSAFYFYASWISFYWSYIKMSIAEFLSFRLENKSNNLHKFLCASSWKISKQVDQIYSKTWDAEWPQQDGLLRWTELRDFVSVGWWWCPFLNSLRTMKQHGKHDPTWTKYYSGELQSVLPSLQSRGNEKDLSVFINCLIHSLVEQQ